MKPVDNHIYNTVDIHNYLTGKLTPAEMHAMERAALTDPFLAEAMEGFATSPSIKEGKAFARLQEELKQLKEKINGEKTIRTNVWKIAASVLSLCGSAIAIYFAMHTAPKKTENIVVNNPKPVNIAPPKPIKPDTGTYTTIHPVASAFTIRKKSPAVKQASENAYAMADRNSAPSSPITNEPGIAKKRASSVMFTAPNIYTGQVTDENNRPIPYANLSVDHHMARSDADGLFNLTTNDTTAEIEVSAKGYSTKVVAFNAGESQTIVLSKTLLNKDTSTDGRLRSTVTVLYQYGADPKEGWANYLQYLVDQLSYSAYDNGKPVKGEMILNFKIDIGSKPTDFQVEQSIDEDVDNAVKDLIVNGPSWKNTKGISTPGSIRLRIIF